MTEKQKIGIGILIIVLLLTGLWPVVIVFGAPLALVYAIYRAIIGIMTHNANLKSKYNQTPNDPTETRWTSGQ